METELKQILNSLSSGAIKQETTLPDLGEASDNMIRSALRKKVHGLLSQPKLAPEQVDLLKLLLQMWVTISKGSE